MPLRLKSVNVGEGNITFRESWPDTSTPGTITLNHVNAHIGTVTNDTTMTADTLITPINGDMMVMNAGLLTFNIGYQLLNPQLTLSCNGHLGSMDASVFNQYLALTEPFTLTGVVRAADFNIVLHDNVMSGTLIPQYDSLNVKFFRWDRFPPGFVSFLANALFMRSHNTAERDHPLHTSEIFATLDRSGSLFWGLWLPIRSAIGSIVRIPEWVW